MDRTFFRIARLIALGVASLFLLCAVIFAVTGLVKAGASANTQYAPPSVSFEQFRKETKAAAEKRQQAARQPAPARREAERKDPNAIPEAFEPFLASIEKSLSTYAEKLGVPGPAAGMRNAVFRQSRQFPDKMQRLYLEGLTTQCKRMADGADAVAALPAGDPGRVFWADFLTYYTAKYKEDLQIQTRRINEDKARASMDNRAASSYYMYAVTSVGCFMFFALLLVLLGIERNTYALRMAQEKAAPRS